MALLLGELLGEEDLCREIDYTSGHVQLVVQLFAWIPQREVVNPVAFLPGRARLFGPAAEGFWCRGDGFERPDDDPAIMASRPFRAAQTVTYELDLARGTGTCMSSVLTTGLSRVITGPAAQRRVLLELDPLVHESNGRLEGRPGGGFMAHACARVADPCPAHAGEALGTSLGLRLAGRLGRASAVRLTPPAGWELRLVVQPGSRHGSVTLSGSIRTPAYPSYAVFASRDDGPARRLHFANAIRSSWVLLPLHRTYPVARVII